MQLNPHPLLKQWSVKTPAPTKDNEAPDPVVRLIIEADLSDELVRLLARVQQSGGGCKLNIEQIQGIFAFGTEQSLP